MDVEKKRGFSSHIPQRLSLSAIEGSKNVSIESLSFSS